MWAEAHKEAFCRCDGMSHDLRYMRSVGAMVLGLQDISLGHESKDSLAVLRNQNDVVRGFGMIAWVSQSQKKVLSHGVTQQFHLLLIHFARSPEVDNN